MIGHQLNGCTIVAAVPQTAGYYVVLAVRNEGHPDAPGDPYVVATMWAHDVPAPDHWNNGHYYQHFSAAVADFLEDATKDAPLPQWGDTVETVLAKVRGTDLPQDKLSVRAYNILRREGIHTTADLLNVTSHWLYERRNIREQDVHQILALQDELREAALDQESEPRIPVWIVSWVYWNGDEQGGGGFNWWPEAGTDRDLVQEAFTKEHEGWVGGVARVRLLKALVPPYQVTEEGRQTVTDWLDAQIDNLESHWPAEQERWAYGADPDNSEGAEPILEQVLREKGLGIDCNADVSAEIKFYLQRHSSTDLGQRLIAAFPNEWSETVDYDELYQAGLRWHSVAGQRAHEAECVAAKADLFTRAALVRAQFPDAKALGFIRDDGMYRLNWIEDAKGEEISFRDPHYDDGGSTFITDAVDDTWKEFETGEPCGDVDLFIDIDKVLTDLTPGLTGGEQ